MENQTTIGKPELCFKIAERTGLSLRTVSNFFDAYHTEIMQAVYEGRAVQIFGFGKFYRRIMGERDSRNPMTGEPFRVASRFLPEFRFGAKFKRLIAKGKVPRGGRKKPHLFRCEIDSLSD